MPGNPRIASAKGRLLAQNRHHPDEPDDEQRRELTEAKLADYIERMLAKAPPLRDEQRSRLAELLQPVRVSA